MQKEGRSGQQCQLLQKVTLVSDLGRGTWILQVGIYWRLQKSSIIRVPETVKLKNKSSRVLGDEDVVKN